MFLAYHPRWYGPWLAENAERLTYSLMGRPMPEYVVVKMVGNNHTLADFSVLDDYEFSNVQKYLEEL